MKTNTAIKFTSLLIATIFLLGGCAGYQTFNHLARSQDTVAVATGKMKTFSKDTIRVTITDNDGTGTQTVYEPGNAKIRAVINLYPDPLSNIVVSRETGENSAPYALAYAGQIDYWYSPGDSDWWQTTVFIDLPAGMVTDKKAAIVIESIDPDTLNVLETAKSFVTIVPGTGEAFPFSAQNPWNTTDPWEAGASYFNMDDVMLKVLERNSHYEIGFDGTETPAALSLDITHNAGTALVVNPTGLTKNIHWTDDGTTSKILILPATSSGFSGVANLKFYISGVDGVAVSNFQAYDINGTEIFTVSPNTPIQR
ncbi:hypothetical protein ACFL3P_00845 [Pseudomonadota bacterium]